VRRLSLLVLATIAVLVPAAVAHGASARQVSIGPLKAKGYQGEISLSHYGRERLQLILDLYRIGASRAQTHRYVVDEPVPRKFNRRLTKGTLKADLGPAGSIDMKFKAKSRKRGEIGPLPGCQGSRGKGTKGRVSGGNGLVLNTGSDHFGTIRLRQAKAAVLQATEAHRCELDTSSASRPTDSWLLAAGDVAPDDTQPFRLVVYAARRNIPHWVEAVLIESRAGLIASHEAVALGDDLLIHDDASSAEVSTADVGPLFTGAAQYTATQGCAAATGGDLRGDLTIAFDDPGPFKPLEDGERADLRKPDASC
jgi:hypothetical protein